MRILWLTNMAPGQVRRQLGEPSGSGLWLDHVLEDLAGVQDLSLRILCPWKTEEEGSIRESCSYATFRKGKATELFPQQEPLFLRQLREFQPDVIHIWGTEYGHALIMQRLCRQEGLLDRTVISIQGLCSIYARHFNEGLPVSVRRKYTFHDFVKQDNLEQQQRAYEKRGAHEVEALKICRHVIGRTHWDRACMELINPGARYHICNETLREPFYRDRWTYENCEKHRIFVSSRVYPVKGFHYMLEALAELRETYPDAVLAVPGTDPGAKDLRSRLHQDGYARYLEELTEKYHLQDAVEYLGSLDGEQMKENYLKANVFVLPSTIENSPNSLGEAMLLGVPCAAADVGGVTTMLEPQKEGLVYQGTAPYMLCNAIARIFRMEEGAENMGRAAAEHARRTHDPEKNIRDLLEIYREMGENRGNTGKDL